MMIPAEIWRRNSQSVTKLIIRDKPIARVVLDAGHQTADADYSNNAFPAEITSSRLRLFKSNFRGKNLMADMLVELRGDDKDRMSKDDKKVPLTSGGKDQMNEPAKSEKSFGSDKKKKDKKSYGSDKKDNMKKDDKIEKLNEDQKNSLRRTLERLLSGN